jgi:transposase, IS5 family
MGVKKKTFAALRDFRAGIEGNISELKRVFGLRRATWKGSDGFGAYVWSSVLSYNLMRWSRLCPG